MSHLITACTYRRPNATDRRIGCQFFPSVDGSPIEVVFDFAAALLVGDI
jgi:hypothetical protein